MTREGFKKLFWGFLFILMDFRIQGIDILPDVIGYLFFAGAIKSLAQNSELFNSAVKLNTAMIFISIVYVYEKPNTQSGVHISQGPFGTLGTVIGIVGFFVSLFLVHKIFMGIKEMGNKHGDFNIASEAGKRWTQYVFLQFAVVFLILFLLIPPLAILYLIGLVIFNLIYIFLVLGFMKRCEIAFSHLD
ncbi:hypothetical protein [Alkalibacter mobilis]|uniref:hypothetical protein n=1 Tax=Alkalibacter mobilis TaxID=2787712 RepID=UPI00189DEE70|nr:hypothetical protein [Alkalibacter mobilis]MBF7097020.1 hypothetical protein [Alkalibacter mobilis]